MNAGGLLLDIDGTLYVGEEPIPGAPEALRELERRGHVLRYLTNTTRFSRDELARRLRAMGFDASPDQLFTAPVAAAAWLAHHGIRRVGAYVPASTLDDFRAFELVPEDAVPDAVVVGDLGPEWTFDRLNHAFRQLLEGARLVALQRNRYWRTPDGLTIDAGAFVAALEYAAGTEAVVVGKPSREFFRLAADSLPAGASSALVASGRTRAARPPSADTGARTGASAAAVSGGGDTAPALLGTPLSSGASRRGNRGATPKPTPDTSH